MDTRREFLKKSALLSGAAGIATMLPPSIQKALAINPAPGSTFIDAEHVVILMQENRSFDHCFGSLQGVRGFNDPRAIRLPNGNPVWCQTDQDGKTYSPFRLNIKDSRIAWMGDLPHSRPSQVDSWNFGKYDNWLLAKRSGHKEYAHMPLTLGYYTREDIPFNYALADAFTVCDQNFSAAMTSTTPNRSFFWTGKISHEEQGAMKAHIRNDDYSYGKLGWTTFPELLQKNGISWKFYQNDVSCGGGFKGEERAWLANFGCNLLEFFAVYNVKFSDRNVKSLINQIETLPDEINKIQEASPSSEEAAKKSRADIAKKQEVLDNATAELKKWNKESFEKLTAEQKELFKRAFVINTGDPNFRNITDLKYKDGNEDRELTVPAGDLFYQFRKDVNEGKLPTVSWFSSPQNFSDHPSAPWYGAWYVSEIIDILTKNPEVWKKTIFILTYDENDGYYDHVVPFSICDSSKPETGKCSAGIETEIEHVRLEAELKQGVPPKQAREAPIGLGYRVPLVVASPWSRGGKVCSELFDHTSTLQFLETFLNQKFKKKIHLDNISQWRRAICGDLTSVFSPFATASDALPFLDQHKTVETIYNAKFKALPGNYKELSKSDIEAIAHNGLGLQEKGTRLSCALPYELYADAKLNSNKVLQVDFKAGNKIFGKSAAGSPFTVYSGNKYKGEQNRNWSFAVKPGDSISYDWNIDEFESGNYHLHLHGPNGFFREFTGKAIDPQLTVSVAPQTDSRGSKATGNIAVTLQNNEQEALTILISDNAYGNAPVSINLAAKSNVVVSLPLTKSQSWYDFSVGVKDNESYRRRYAGRIESGKVGITDPFMGRV
ncbi:phospholipase C, phosphocholine-specific [Chitinophaga silvatica]|uniref:phospholipase C n=1 Tax=Chitinophaga silvatica TaxID=2282649 RepID=A0A3E1Y292_9BACT|nr:phospholipase C, phosphocholine-specific [Chitinophaga silvatica]RFS18784.1 phospholipase C, phosphocholine-specific [Chitinophaga silvatica]